MQPGTATRKSCDQRADKVLPAGRLCYVRQCLGSSASILEGEMNLSAPTMWVFLIALVIAIIALLIYLGVITFIPIAAFWVMTLAYVVLAIGCLIRGA
jgi:hypothetical protein